MERKVKLVSADDYSIEIYNNDVYHQDFIARISKCKDWLQYLNVELADGTKREKVESWEAVALVKDYLSKDDFCFLCSMFILMGHSIRY